MKLPALPWNLSPLGFFRSHGKALRVTALLLLLALSGYIFCLDVVIREAFEGRKFALPARVYGRALEVYPGAKLTPVQLVEELRNIGYHEHPDPDEAGTYKHTLNGLEFTTREFVFGDGPQGSHLGS